MIGWKNWRTLGRVEERLGKTGFMRIKNSEEGNFSLGYEIWSSCSLRGLGGGKRSDGTGTRDRWYRGLGNVKKSQWLRGDECTLSMNRLKTDHMDSDHPFPTKVLKES